MNDRRLERARAVEVHSVTLLRVLRSEWIKLWTLRSTWFTLAAALVGMVGVGYLVSYETQRHFASMSVVERLTFDPTLRSEIGVYLAQLAIGVLGVLVISGEYATGMIRATLGAVPTRLPVLWAKLAVFGSVTFVVTLMGSFAAFLGGQELLQPYGTTLSAPQVLRAVIGVALYLTVVALLSVGLGFLIRSTAGGIAALFGLLLVLPVIVTAFPTSWQNHVLPYLPSLAGSALFNPHPAFALLAPWTGFGVACAWAAAAILAAAIAFRHRDA
jgi:ABC-type transport system involved in multi-copper enzyme maturation permease subunit